MRGFDVLDEVPFDRVEGVSLGAFGERDDRVRAHDLGDEFGRRRRPELHGVSDHADVHKASARHFRDAIGLLDQRKHRARGGGRRRRSSQELAQPTKHPAEERITPEVLPARHHREAAGAHHARELAKAALPIGEEHQTEHREARVEAVVGVRELHAVADDDAQAATTTRRAALVQLLDHVGREIKRLDRGPRLRRQARQRAWPGGHVDDLQALEGTLRRVAGRDELQRAPRKGFELGRDLGRVARGDQVPRRSERERRSARGGRRRQGGRVAHAASTRGPSEAPIPPFSGGFPVLAPNHVQLSQGPLSCAA
jgi:hypothetical protein